MKIQLLSAEFGCYLILAPEKTSGVNTLLVQTDWDFPGVAGTFGWQACPCGFTDGTVDCKHKTASEMIRDAAEFLDSIADTETFVDDPGYFSEE